MRGAAPRRTGHARLLRAAGTNAEAILWLQLRNRRLGGFKFVRQTPIGPYYVDFVCREARLVVEVDGSQHAGNPTDRHRDRVLASLGYRVVRVWNNDVSDHMDSVLEMLLSQLRSSPSPAALGAAPSPRKRGEGEAARPAAQSSAFCAVKIEP